MLETESQISQQVTVLRCYGRLVHGDGAEALRQAVMSQDESLFAIDLSGVEAIDAAGLGVLVELEKWAIDRGATIHFLNPSPQVHEVLQRRDWTGSSKFAPLVATLHQQRSPVHSE